MAILAALFINLSIAQAADPEWKAGFASAKITPSEPVFLAGYASRNKPSEGVVNDLYAKVFALEDAAGQKAVLITTDLIGFRAEISDPLCERIMEQTGLKRAQILLNSSHTHTGPGLARSDRASYNIPEKDRPNADYVRQLEETLIATVQQALARLEPATLDWGNGAVNFVMNRREFTPRGVVLGVNPRGPVDRSVPVLRVHSPEGKLRGVIYGAACHNTTLSGRDYQISGDYAGFSQEYIEAQHPGAVAMFMQGLGGDANPYPKGSYEIAREHGATLGGEVCRVLETKLQPVRGPLRVEFGWADLPLQPMPSPAEIETLVARGASYQKYTAGKMLELQGRGEKLGTHYRAPLALWQFGEDLTLVGLSGEVVVDFVFLLEKALGPLNLWLSAYCNDVYGYLPSARVLEEGGYETRGLIHGGIGFFSPEAEVELVKQVGELAQRAGRKLPAAASGSK